MKCTPECIHCYLKQSVICMNNDGSIPDSQQINVLYEIMRMIPSLDPERTPSENASQILLKTYELINNDDPYKKAKDESNVLALNLLPELREIIAQSDDKVLTALKIAAAGNIIDLGIQKNFDVHKAIKNALEQGFSIDDYAIFKEKYKTSKEIVVTGDNAGEIGFDKLLVEQFIADGKKVKFIVKDQPILNDATIEDAEFVGLTEIAEVISTGARYLGTEVGIISKECEDILRNAELVISKGQANYETLESEPVVAEKVFFLLKLKCDEVVESIGDGVLGQVVFIHH